MANQPQVNLTTIERVKTQLLTADFNVSVPTPGQPQYANFVAFMLENIPEVSQETSNALGGLAFIPYVDTKDWIFSDLAESSFFINIIHGARLYLRDYLQSVSLIEWDGTTLDVFDSSTNEGDYMLMPRRYFPFTQIDFRSSSLPLALSSNNFGAGINVTGVWGYHSFLGQLYTATADSVTIDDSVTEITVDDKTIYEQLQYIRIEDELLLITSFDDSLDKLNVTRGVNGTTNAAHDAQTIEQVNPMKDAQSFATYLAAYAWQNRNMVSDNIQITDIGVVVPKMPVRFKRIQDKYSAIIDSLTMGMH